MMKLVDYVAGKATKTAKTYGVQPPEIIDVTGIKDSNCPIPGGEVTVNDRTFVITGPGDEVWPGLGMEPGEVLLVRSAGKEGWYSYRAKQT